jgi:peptidoglycan/xylan/chitin deacetylase (PgdA/CDA1 family)
VPPDRVLNICFHGIGEPGRALEPGEDLYWVGTDDYLRILDVLVDRADVRLSFDDGNRSDVEHGLPGLRERGLSATFFVIAGRLGEPGSLDEDAARELRDHGMQLGVHGMTHRSWRGMDEATARHELVDARARVADLAGRAVELAAMPLGQYDRTALSQLRRCGYRHVFSSDRAPARQGAWLQPRFSVRSCDTPASIRREVLSGPSWSRRLERGAVGWAKRLR